MYCSKCGHKIEDNQNFCEICGTSQIDKYNIALNKIKKLLSMRDKYTNNKFFIVLMVVFNLFVFAALFSYIEYFVISKVAPPDYCNCMDVVNQFVLLPFVTLIWLRLNPTLPKLLFKVEAKNFPIKSIVNGVIFVILIYNLAKYYSKTVFHWNFLYGIFPIHYLPGLSGHFSYYQNFNLIIGLYEILVVLVLLCIIYILNFESRKCPKCNAKISLKSKFCSNCAFKLK